MAKKEVKTDLWVYDLLKQAEITSDAQGEIGILQAPFLDFA